MRSKIIWFLCAAGLAAATACSSSECDPGQVYSHGLCYPDVDAAPEEDAGPDAASEPFAHYGDVCAETEQCAAPSNYCAVEPGNAEGYCTHTGCLEDASVCPGGWSCLDLSQFQPDLPSICVAP